MRGSQNHPWGTNSALRATAFQESLLQGMQLPAGANPLNGRNTRSRCLQNRNQAAIHQRAVHQHRARSTFTFSVSFFHTGQSQLLTQHIQQAHHREGAHGSWLPVHRERNLGPSANLRRLIHRTALAASDSLTNDSRVSSSKMSSGSNGIESNETPSASSTAFRIAGAGPSMGSSPIPFAPNAPCTLPSSSKNTRMGGRSLEVGMM